MKKKSVKKVDPFVLSPVNLKMLEENPIRTKPYVPPVVVEKRNKSDSIKKKVFNKENKKPYKPFIGEKGAYGKRKEQQEQKPRDSRPYHIRGPEMNAVPVPLEHKEQEAFVQWASLNREIGDYLFAIPNGGSRNKIEARNLKYQGVKRGVPDLFLAVASSGCHGLFIEMKRNKIAKPVVTPEQADMIVRLSKKGYKVVIAYGCDEAIAAVKEYLIERR